MNKIMLILIFCYLSGVLFAQKQPKQNNNAKTQTVVKKLKIGDNHAGGIIFYLDSTGKHGLVCAANDQSAEASWAGFDCDGTAIKGLSTAVGSGLSNTQLIIKVCPETAAKICDDLVLNGFNDWFLPSKDELNLMFVNLAKIQKGNFAKSLYWSSNQKSAWSGWVQNFETGAQTGCDMIKPFCVRAVRAF